MKRFFKEVTTAAQPAGYSIALDGKSVRTPSGALLCVPTQPLADAIAAEWVATEDTITPAQLPLTQLSNTAIDRTGPDSRTVITAISAYIETDLLCYRAEAPISLFEAQQTHWDPPLAWLKETAGIALSTTTNLLGHQQDPGARKAFEALLTDQDTFALTALHQMTTLLGSAVLALYLARGAAAAEAVWQAASVDEEHQMMRWGEDEEARQSLEKKHGDFQAAVRFWTKLQSPI